MVLPTLGFVRCKRHTCDCHLKQSRSRCGDPDAATDDGTGHVRQRLRHSPLIIKFGIDSICYAASCSWQLYVQVMLRSLVGLLLALALIQCFVRPLEAHLLHTSWANDSHSLLAALADPSVGRVVLTGAAMVPAKPKALLLRSVMVS